MNLPRYTLRRPQKTQTANSQEASASRAPGLAALYAAAAQSSSESGDSGSPAAATVHRQFSMPDLAIAQPVKQTIVRSDIPEPVLLRQEVALPNMMLIPAETLPTAPARRFVPPPIHQVKAAQLPAVSMPTTPDIQVRPELPNGIKPLEVTDVRLPVPSAPLAVRHDAPARPSRTALMPNQDGAPPTISALSISENPALPADIFALPAANQIAPGSGLAVGSSHGGGNGTGVSGSGSGGTSEGARGKGQGDGTQSTQNSGKGAGLGGSAIAGADGTGDGLVAANIGGLGSGGSGTGGAGGNGAGTGTSGSAMTGSGTVLDVPIPGTTTIALPKEGHFGVVVTGSDPGAPYPESYGRLGGALVYTVYLRVGQRKNWILQYCLPKSALAQAPRLSGRPGAPLEGPYPYHMVRPDQTADTDYALVHGMVNADGRFEQLALAFPQDLELKDLLIRSLNQWGFRPAKRDGVPVAVEVLLIIPRETD